MALQGKPTDTFSEILSVYAEDIEFDLQSIGEIPWLSFWLNPRRLRGSDFLMRWSQGQWSEERLVDAANATQEYYAVPYGPSSVAPDNNVRDFELYFERLEIAGLDKLKRPDLLIFEKGDKHSIEQIVQSLDGLGELPFTSENDDRMQELLQKSLVAVECENSLWKAQQMPAFGKTLKPQKRLGGKLGLPKNAVLPTVIIKEEDRGRLLDWQSMHSIPIHIWHAFYDMAFGLALDKANELIAEGAIQPTIYNYQSANGSVSRKVIYNFYYQYAYPLAVAESEPQLVAAHITDKNGHIMPYVRFEGGSMSLTQQALEVLSGLVQER